jgi:tRNA (guanine-N7-)-methyltransferase
MYWNFSDILVTPDAGKFSTEDGAFVVEVGFGNGEFLEYLASKTPDATVVGFEVSQWCVAKAARRALAAGLRNVRIVWGDARFLLRRTFEPGTVRAVYMNFPCPWPKRRHADRRVAGDLFADALSACLAPGGRFALATDVEWYALAAEEIFRASGEFDSGGVTRNPAREYLTKYERKWQEMGRDTYLVEAAKMDDGMTRVKEADDDIAEDAIEAVCPSSWDAARELLESLKGDEIEGPRYRVVFKDAFFSGNDAALILAISVDEGFEQHYYIKVVRAGGKLRGKVDSVGHPYRTPGVRASLRHVMRRTGARF